MRASSTLYVLTGTLGLACVACGDDTKTLTEGGTGTQGMTDGETQGSTPGTTSTDTSMVTEGTGTIGHTMGTLPTEGTATMTGTVGDPTGTTGTSTDSTSTTDPIGSTSTTQGTTTDPSAGTDTSTGTGTDTGTASSTGGEECDVPPNYLECDQALMPNDPLAPFQAIGLGCPGDDTNSISISNTSFNSTNPAAWRIARGFGTYHEGNDPNNPLYYSAREGDSFLMISTGVIAAPDMNGVVVEASNSQKNNGDNGNDDSNNLPAPFSSNYGSNGGTGGTPFLDCDKVGDCSDTLKAQWDLGEGNPNDKIWFTFDTKVPPGAKGYSFNFVFCSSEYPMYVNYKYNDLVVAWQVSELYTGNVTFVQYMDQQLPLSVTSLAPYLMGAGFAGNEPQLKGTGFETRGCTEWFLAKGGVAPDETITFGVLAADMGDSILATVALLDNWRWDCMGCVPSEVNDCGIQPQ